ncbi:BTAD domain-containing putative transcriptional regulator [Micromonospora sp. NPDC051196]|uniref:AfsR/SARP family transcriptional regulator n=1 Tax=Micromonospora sp. NPDC051196 TaxID=3155281 RepID=UPI0034438F8A
MLVRLLGPVDVTVDGEVRPVSGLRRKAVLATLGLHAGTIVSVDRLIDLVWGEKAPATGLNTLQRHISFLRGVLGSGSAIVARPPGYLLSAGTDVALADEHVKRGRQADDPLRGAMHFRAALDLWRGPSLIDVADLTWLQQQGERLDNLRLDAVQGLVDARLRLGEHAQLVPELEALAKRHPFHERVHGQLMLALYRAGRQADALAVYGRLRRTLDEELGIGPGRQLRDLQAAVLRQDADLDPPTRPVTAQGIPLARPAQLPAALSTFAGRTEELAQLDLLPGVADDAPSTVVISAVSGTAGVGKTALAVHWAHQVARRFPDGQLYVNLRGFDPVGPATEPAEALRRFLDALGVPAQRIPAELNARAALYRSLLADKRMLILLDNARDAVQVRPLLPGAAGSLVIVTSRNQLTPLVVTEGARLLPLDLPSPDEARLLLRRRLGDDRWAADPEVTDEIIRRCARLPLALAVVAAHAAARPELTLARLAVELGAAAGALATLDGGDPVSDVRSVLSWSYLALKPDAARMFQLLGVHPGPDISAAAAASLAGLADGPTAALLDQLCRANLLTESVPGRFSFHDLLREYARELTGQPGDPEVRGRVLDHYLHTAVAANRLINPSWEPIEPAAARPGVTPEPLPDADAAQRWFATELPVLLAAIAPEHAIGFDAHAWQVAWTLTDFLERRGLWSTWESVHQAGLRAAERLSDLTGQGHLHRGLGRLRMWQHRSAEATAHFEQAEQIFARIGDIGGQARTQHNLCQLADQDGRPEAALTYAERSLDLCRTVGDPLAIAKELNTVGWCHGQLGNLGQARRYCEEALAIFRMFDDPGQEAPVWHSLGSIHHRMGDDRRAIDCYERTVRLSRVTGDQFAHGNALDHLGDSQFALGDTRAARHNWTQAMRILAELAHPRADQICTKLHDLPGRQ